MTAVDGSVLAHDAAEDIAPGRYGALDRTLVRGIAWTGLVKWGTQAVSWGATVLVARILSPADYGLVGMATLLLKLVQLLSEAGIGTSIVNLREMTREQVAQINTLAFLAGLVGAAVSCAMAAPLAAFFDQPRLVAVVLAMSAVFPISALRTVPWALAQRDHAFRALAVIDGAGTLFMSGVMITLAASGAGYWTLVAGSILSAALSTSLVNVYRPHPFARPVLASVRSALALSGRVVSSRLAWFLYSNADFLVAAKLLGQSALGTYKLAWTFANAPVDRFAGLATTVAPSILATVQRDVRGLRRYLLTVTEGIAIIGVPTSWGMALVARDFTLAFLGPKWEPMILPLQLLTFYAFFRSVTPLLQQTLVAMGEAAFEMRVSMLMLTVLPVGFVLGSRYGLGGVAAAWLVLHPACTMLNLRRVCRRLEMSVLDYAAALRPALVGGVAMAAAVVGTSLSLPEGAGHGVRLAAEIAVGAVTYAGVMLLTHGARLGALRAALREVRA